MYDGSSRRNIPAHAADHTALTVATIHLVIMATVKNDAIEEVAVDPQCQAGDVIWEVGSVFSEQ